MTRLLIVFAVMIIGLSAVAVGAQDNVVPASKATFQALSDVRQSLEPLSDKELAKIEGGDTRAISTRCRPIIPARPTRPGFPLLVQARSPAMSSFRTSRTSGSGEPRRKEAHGGWTPSVQPPFSL